jgi:hypothetical protein
MIDQSLGGAQNYDYDLAQCQDYAREGAGTAF